MHRGLSSTGSSGLAGVSSTVGTGSGTETLESGGNRGDPTVGSSEIKYVFVNWWCFN